MGILSFLKAKTFYPFTHNPEDFKLRIVPTGGSSGDFIKFIYSANGERDWKTIYRCHDPFLGSLKYDYEWEPAIYLLRDGDFTAERSKFSSYQKILDFEQAERLKYEEGMKSTERRRQEIKDKKAEALKRANL